MWQPFVNICIIYYIYNILYRERGEREREK